MRTKSFENLTIVSITGAIEYAQGSIFAIQRSCEQLKGAKGLLICPKLPDDIILPSNIEHREIAPFGYLEYNLFVLYQLEYYIDTDYCLIVQDDGWVLNGENWDDRFWDYDYIGAPIPNYCQHKNGVFTTMSTEDYFKNLHLLETEDYIEPQNGGFSFRSKKMLSMPRKLGLVWHVVPPLPMNPQNPKSKLNFKGLIHNEDMFITAYKRPEFIKSGIRFAPSALASKFAVESVLLHQLRHVSLNSTLGMHFYGLVRLVGYNEAELYLPNQFKNSTREDILDLPHVRLLAERYDYTIRVLIRN